VVLSVAHNAIESLGKGSGEAERKQGALPEPSKDFEKKPGKLPFPRPENLLASHSIVAVFL
jgi:hypothetical protein